MLGNRGERHLERFRHVRDGHVILQQHRQDLPAGRVGEGRENGVEIRAHVAGILPTPRIVNRVVE